MFFNIIVIKAKIYFIFYYLLFLKVISVLITKSYVFLI